MPARRRIAVCVSSRIQLDTVSPWIPGLREAGLELRLVATPSLLRAAEAEGTPFAGGEGIEDTGLRGRSAGRLHSLVASVTTPPAFSSHYQRSIARGRGGGLRRRLARMVGGPDTSAVRSNELAARAARALGAPGPAGDAVLVVSLCSYPHRVAAAAGPRLTLMESWDHPRSRPAGYRSEVVAGWNRELTDDWIRYQGAERGIVGYPTKLRYAIDDPVSHLGEGRPLTIEKGRLLYAATSSAHTPRRWLFGEELRVIDALAAATERLALCLHVKPKPNGRPGEFDAVAAKYSNVSVGRYGTASGPVDYVLDAAYNHYRLKELASVDAVINVGTTYGLDAAAAGVPVLQLDVRSRADLPDLAQAQEAWHLAHHLLGRSGVVPVAPEASLGQALERAVDDGISFAPLYASLLRDWLIPPGSFSDAVARLAGALDELSR